jgi:hypothetical protein
LPIFQTPSGKQPVNAASNPAPAAAAPTRFNFMVRPASIRRDIGPEPTSREQCHNRRPFAAGNVSFSDFDLSVADSWAPASAF